MVFMSSLHDTGLVKRLPRHVSQMEFNGTDLGCGLVMPTSGDRFARRAELSRVSAPSQTASGTVLAVSFSRTTETCRASALIASRRPPANRVPMPSRRRQRDELPIFQGGWRPSCGQVRRSFRGAGMGFADHGDVAIVAMPESLCVACTPNSLALAMIDKR